MGNSRTLKDMPVGAHIQSIVVPVAVGSNPTAHPIQKKTYKIQAEDTVVVLGFGALVSLGG